MHILQMSLHKIPPNHGKKKKQMIGGISARHPQHPGPGDQTNDHSSRLRVTWGSEGWGWNGWMA